MVVYPLGHRSKKAAVNPLINHADSLVRYVKAMHQIVLGRLGYGYYSHFLSNTLRIKIKIALVSMIRRADKGFFSIHVKVSD